MTIKQGREYRALQDFSLVPRDENSPEYRVRGTAIVFNTPTVLRLAGRSLHGRGVRVFRAFMARRYAF